MTEITTETMEIVKTTVISTKTVTEMAEMTTETTTETETMKEAISETEIMATDQTMIEAALEEMTEMMPHQNQFRIRTERIEKTKSARIDRNVIRKITKMAEEVRMARRVISLNLH